MAQFLDPLLIMALALNFVALGREPDPRRHQRGRRCRGFCWGSSPCSFTRISGFAASSWSS